MNKIGVCDWYLLTPGIAAIRQAGEMGCDSIQISDLGGMTKNFPLRDPRLRAEYQEAASEFKVQIYSLQCSGMYLEPGLQCSKNTPDNERCMENFRLAVETCRDMNIPTIMIASAAKARFTNEEELQNTAVSLKAMAQIAVDNGLVIAYEHFCPSDVLLRIMDYVGDGLGVAYDNHNMVRDRFDDPLEVIHRIGADRITYVHLKDCSETRIGCVPLGKGICKTKEVIELLIKSGYSGQFFEENNVFLPPLCFEKLGRDILLDDLTFIRDTMQASLA